MQTQSNQLTPVTVAMTGASGVQYGMRLMECLFAQNVPVFLMVSKAAQMVITTETEESWPANPDALKAYLVEKYDIGDNLLQVFGREDWLAPVASGSSGPGQMVICPCSTGTLSAIACGASNNLIERAADVVLKERKKLILLVREMPLSEIHLENMLKLSRMGAVVMPAAPGFYHQPESIDDMVDFVVARVLDQLSIPQTMVPRWGYGQD
ncbi:flavin prenyltransferase UbiX [Litoribrevibacter albus]|uniref:Flavin prenyltransferase UbiX n=1 Tax=Litoribrevibacter albus TaxID=1473156 RepID=A0AA37W5L6_9GAMM|nr:flavin prenyltransferase UbiX [Litoribrevibacter albus]GLQ31317.1 flavin prenyltransferase UbiX [Litoribrevibacter albus]